MPSSVRHRWDRVCGRAGESRAGESRAGDKSVQVIGGVSVVRQVLQAGLVDELHLDVMPVLLGRGLRLFEDADLEDLRLEKIDVHQIGARTSFRFRVNK